MIAYITINIDPVLFHIGSLSLRWNSLLMVAATIVGVFIFAGQLRRKGIESGHVVVRSGFPCSCPSSRGIWSRVHRR
jgi:prolipoprotein diacylglyceryltransferase